MSSTVTRPPYPDPLVIDPEKGLGKGDGMAIVTDLRSGINLLPGEAIAGPKIAVVIEIQPATQDGPLRIKRHINSHFLLLSYVLCSEYTFLTHLSSKISND